MELSDDSSKPIFRPLKRRFYVLLTFSIFSFINGFLFNIWQPILNSLHELFHWNLTEINMLANMYAIVFMVGIVPFVCLWNKFGMKTMYDFSIFILLFGNFIRLLPCSPQVLGILIQVSNMITAFASLMCLTGLTVISSLWFPGHERARATAFCYAMNTLGNAVSPLIASSIVPDVNISKIHSNNSNEVLRPVLEGIHNLNFLTFALSLLILFMSFIYFPAKPPILPAKSSESHLRIDLIPGIKQLSRNKNFWLVFVCNFILNGVMIGMGSVFTSIILPLGISQWHIGILNTVTCLFIFIFNVVGGYLADKFHPKTIILVVVPLISISYIVWGLQVCKIISYDIIAVYAVNTLTSIFSSLPSAIQFEMGCEVAFPVSEEVSTAIISFGLNLGVAVFLLITMIPNIGVKWIPFAYAGLVLLVIPCMLLFEEDFNRKKVDHERTIEVLDHDSSDECDDSKYDDEQGLLNNHRSKNNNGDFMSINSSPPTYEVRRPSVTPQELNV